MITTLFKTLLFIDIIWIAINWFERIQDEMENAPYTEGSYCILECVLLVLGIMWLNL